MKQINGGNDFNEVFFMDAVTPADWAAVRAALVGLIYPGNPLAAVEAAIEGFDVAGKTGTAQKADQHGYLPGCYYASFVGFFVLLIIPLCGILMEALMSIKRVEASVNSSASF